MKTLDLEAAQALGVLGAEAAGLAQAIEGLVVGGVVVEERPHVLAVHLVGDAAERADALAQALLEETSKSAVGWHR